MERNKVIKQGRMPRAKRKDVIISIRISQEMADFIDRNNFSIPLIFTEALKQLGFNDNNEKGGMKK